MKEKWIGFSRRAWGAVLAVGSFVLALLTYVSPDTVATILTPVFLLAEAIIGQPIDPAHQDRARNGLLAASLLVGVFALVRARMAPDGTTLSVVPPAMKSGGAPLLLLALVLIPATLLACAEGPGLQYVDAETQEVRQINAACDTVSEGGTAAIEEWRDFAKPNEAALRALDGGDQILADAKLAQVALDEALEVLEPMCLGLGAEAGSADRMRVRIQAVQAARDRLLGVLLLAQGLLGGGAH